MVERTEYYVVTDHRTGLALSGYNVHLNLHHVAWLLIPQVPGTGGPARAWEVHDPTAPAAPSTCDSTSRSAGTKSWFQEHIRAGDEVRPNVFARGNAFPLTS
jgi:hypothetical protein